MKITVKSLGELKILAKKLQQASTKMAWKNGATIALIGELGAGKTTFTKFFLRAAGIKKTITSPTFVLMVPYKKAGRVYHHLDLYRTKNFKEIAALGVPEIWKRKGQVLLIEWANKIKKYLPKNTIHLKFKILPAKKSGNHKTSGRQIEILNIPRKIAKILS